MTELLLPGMIPLERREALAARRDLTLNGNPARITGTHRRFAVVTDLTTRLSAEWSWESAERVVQNGGNFRS